MNVDFRSIRLTEGFIFGGASLLGIYGCGRLSGVGDDSFLHTGIQIME
jgi:hypothetical protein